MPKIMVQTMAAIINRDVELADAPYATPDDTDVKDDDDDDLK